jgi:riboflavin kinase/FMN adenylyltransferase
MQLLHGFGDPPAYRGGFVSIGNFDGVHRGHQSMIAELIRLARAAAVPAVVFTFDPHPISILRPDQAPPPLSTLERKTELLAACGVDEVIAYPTDRALLNLTPDEFFQRIILGEMAARGLVEGPNFFYGHNRAGNVQTLQASCAAAGIQLEVVPPVQVGERLVSSTAIRELITEGDLPGAAELLGYRYRIRGIVTPGAGRGRTIGFPTANVTGVQTVLPRDGVYAGLAHFQGQRFTAALNLGPNPTFGESQRKLEVHLLDFQGDLYGETLDVEFLERIRDTVRFDGVDQLASQLQQDCMQARTLAERLPAG